MSSLLLRTLAVICVLLGSERPLTAATISLAPEAEKVTSFPLSAAAIRRVEPLAARDLGDDAHFVATLLRILEEKDLESSEKVDAFYLMLRKIGWEFSGSVRLFPGSTYHQTFLGMASTYFGYQQRVEAASMDPAPFLALANTGCDENVVRCSHALLLATILDSKRSAESVRTLLDPGKIRASEVPDILLHNLALSVMLTRDFELARKLASLLRDTTSEEGQEDILCAMSIFDDAQLTASLKEFLREALTTKWDSAVEIGFVGLAHRLPEADFRAFYSQLTAGVSDPARRERLVAIEKDDFAPLFQSAPSGWIKVWDGFSVSLFDDGMVLRYGSSFRAFKPN